LPELEKRKNMFYDLNSSRIEDLELLGDLGNGTCGHVVEMRHRDSSQVIAVKQVSML
jgi:hypothetical protein